MSFRRLMVQWWKRCLVGRSMWSSDRIVVQRAHTNCFSSQTSARITFEIQSWLRYRTRSANVNKLPVNFVLRRRRAEYKMMITDETTTMLLLLLQLLLPRWLMTRARSPTYRTPSVPCRKLLTRLTVLSAWHVTSIWLETCPCLAAYVVHCLSDFVTCLSYLYFCFFYRCLNILLPLW